MPVINKPLIDYTSRDFKTIKRDLVNYAQKYYPQTMQDFNEASFGSLMLDLVSYVGDILSFYIDYQANESFLETAIEFDNVLNLSKQLGFKYKPNPSSFGDVSFFILLPVAAGTIAPDYAYAPILRKGSTFSTVDGILFTLMEDVDFSQSTDAAVGKTNAVSGAPESYAIKAKGLVISGELLTQNFVVDDYQRFLRIQIPDSNVTEIVAVFDSLGNNYFEVDYLTQDTVYTSVLNNEIVDPVVRNILKPISVPRRFVVEQTNNATFLQFGYGTGDNEEKVLDPANVILNVFGKNYFTDQSFDPTVLIKTDKLGIVPTNTVLTVLYRRNSAADVNAAAGLLRHSVHPEFKFRNAGELGGVGKLNVQNSLELTNEDPINGDVPRMSAQELKYRAYGTYAAQNRAVTKDDYINLIYNMPPNFGKVTKATVTRDVNSFNGKNLNLYVITSNVAGHLVPPNSVIKQNLKTWINQYKMIGDTIDILDARVINLQIFFTAVSLANVNKYDVLQLCINTITQYIRSTYYDIGEPFKITDIYKLLNNLSVVADVKDVTVVPKEGTGYSDFSVVYDDMISNDGRYLIPPPEAVFEVRNLGADIDGEIL
jgi:hypothetical protein